MKVKLKGGGEVDAVSKARKKGILSPPSGGWHYYKNKINRRIRKERVEIDNDIQT